MHVLTEDDRRQLGDDYQASFQKLGTIDMWRALKSGTLIKATLDVAFEIGFLTDRSYRWLLRETENEGQHVERTPGQTIARPTWDRDTGTLSWGADVVGKFRIQREASQTEQILNAFQAADWAVRVENPLANLLRVQVAQALRYLNGEQSVIRFHAQESSRYLRWERTTADPIDAV